MCDRGQHLRGPDVGASVHSYSAIGERQRRRPFDGVVAVIRFVQEGIPFSVRRVASANILVDYDITAGCSPIAEAGVIAFIVRSSREKNGEFSRCRRPVNIGAKHGPVAHGGRDTVFHGHRIGVGRKSQLWNQDQSCERGMDDDVIDCPDVQAHGSFSVGFFTSRIKPKRSGT